MTPVMSFWPDIYNKISHQIKLVEYRRNLPKNCNYAYMYVSKPVKAICGIVYFGQQYCISDWESEYSTDPILAKRISKYKTKYRYGVEISAFQKIKPISLYDLKNNIPNFNAPQSYILLENNPTLEKYLHSNVVFIGEKITNNLLNIFPEHICKEY